jgi:hypothetical protein
MPISVVPPAPFTHVSHRQQIDLQLTIMLYLQTLIAIITFVPYGAQVFYVNITGGWIKSPVRQAWELLITGIINLSSYLFAATGFYVSMVSNRGFREQFFRSFGWRRAIQPT